MLMKILETVSYGINLAYASRNRFPFSTYGENFFLTIQNVIITLLILSFSSGQRTVGAGLAVTLLAAMLLWHVSPRLRKSKIRPRSPSLGTTGGDPPPLASLQSSPNPVQPP